MEQQHQDDDTLRDQEYPLPNIALDGTIIDQLRWDAPTTKDHPGKDDKQNDDAQEDDAPSQKREKAVASRAQTLNP